MFLVESDEARAAAVCFIGPPAGDADWEAYLATVDRMNRSVSGPERPVFLQVFGSGAPFPSAVFRKRIAELRRTIRPETVNVIVAGTATIRGVQIALDWLRKPHYDSSTHADVDGAIAHAEKVTGRDLTFVRVMHARVLKRALGG